MPVTDVIRLVSPVKVDEKAILSALKIVRSQISSVNPSRKPLLTPARAAQALIFTSQLIAGKLSAKKVSYRELLAAETMLAFLSTLPIRELLKLPEAGLRISLVYPICDFSRILRSSYGVRYSREAVQLQADIVEAISAEVRSASPSLNPMLLASRFHSLLTFISLLINESKEIGKATLLNALSILEKVPSVSEDEVRLLYSLNAITRSQLLVTASMMEAGPEDAAELKNMLPEIPPPKQAGIGARPRDEAAKLLYCLMKVSGKPDLLESILSQLAAQLSSPPKPIEASQQYIAGFMRLKNIYVRSLHERLGRSLVLKHPTSIGRLASIVYLLSISSLQQREGEVLDSQDLYRALYALADLLIKLAPLHS